MNGSRRGVYEHYDSLQVSGRGTYDPAELMVHMLQWFFSVETLQEFSVVVVWPLLRLLLVVE